MANPSATIFDVAAKWKAYDVRSLVERENGENSGLEEADALAVFKDGELRVLRPREDYPETGAFVIAAVEPGKLIVGGRSDLLEFDGKKWSVLRSGLDRIRSVIRTQNGTLWVASGSGVHRRQNGNWISNAEEDGLPSSTAYRVFEDSQGRVWVGTSRGVSLFHPERDLDAPRTQLSMAANSRCASPGGRNSYPLFRGNGQMAK